MKKVLSFTLALLLVAGCSGTVLPVTDKAGVAYAEGADEYELPIMPVGDDSSEDSAPADDTSSEGSSDSAPDDSADSQSEITDDDEYDDSIDSKADEPDDSVSDSDAPDTPWEDEHEWSESDEEAQARALDYSFETVFVFKDKTEKKADIGFEYTNEKAYTSYRDTYFKRFSHEEFDELLSGMGKKYDDIDHVEYRLTFTNGEDTNFGEGYFIEAYIGGRATSYDDSNNPWTGGSGKEIYEIGKPVTVHTFSHMAEEYDGVEFSFNINYATAKVYKPTEEHKKALKVNIDPKLAILLEDGTEIMTDTAYEMESDGYERIFFAADISAEDVKKYITDAGHKVEEFKCFIGYAGTDFPEELGVREDDVITGISYYFSAGDCLKMNVTRSYGFGTSSRMLPSTIAAVNDKLEIGRGGSLKGTVVLRGENGEYDWDNEIDETMDHVDYFYTRFTFELHEAELKGSETNTPLAGDLSGDGERNVTDLMKLAAYVKGIKGLDDDQLELADINRDGDGNVTDVMMLAADVKGIRPIPENK